MSRPYPLDPTDHSAQHQDPAPESWGMRLAVAAAQALLDLREWRRRHPDLSQAVIGITLLAIGALLGAGAAVTDSYLHRGVESGAERPYVVQPTAKTLATNVDLRPFATNPAVITTALVDAGFQVVRQEFSWNDIEPRRGSLDWNVYDPIMEDLSRRGFTVIAVITETPVWARPIGTSGFENAPPRDPALLRSFTETLAHRYGNAIGFVQLWDAPNLTSGWGGTAATGVDFAPYLQAFALGARQGDPTIHVVSPELAPVSDATHGGQSDLAFLDALYASGTSAYFDVVGVSLDGGTFSPDDRRVAESRGNLSRVILYRELMIDRDDAATPIWATSFGWAIGPSVSREEQAEFVVRGLERSWSEWPWMGLMVQWAFIANDDSPLASRAIILLPEASSTPLYRALTSEDIQQRSRIANTGFMPMEFSGLQYSSGWRDQHLEGRTFRTTQQVGAAVSITFRGTGLIAYVRSGPQQGAFLLDLDGRPVPGGAGDDGSQWDFTLYGETRDIPRLLVQGLDDSVHTVSISLATDGELTLGGFEVVRDAPFVWPIVLMTIASILALFFGLRSIALLIAIRSGHLHRKSWFLSDPPLPELRSVPLRRQQR